MKLVIVSAALLGLTCAPALAAPIVAGNGANLLGNPAPSAPSGAVAPVNVPASAAKPAGQVVTEAGKAGVVASGAHAGGPAPIVAGAIPQTRPFADGVTDGTAKIGKGAKTTGQTVEHSGLTISPAGAEKGLGAAPGNLDRQTRAAAGLASVPR